MVKSTVKLILLAITSSVAISSYAQDNIVDEIIWVVGDEAILKSDVENVRTEMIASGQRFEGDPYCFIPEQLAVQKLFLDQAKIDSIVVPDSDINGNVAMHERRVIAELGSKEKVEEYLKAPITQLREQWKEDMKNNYMVEQAQQNIIRKAKPLTPADVRKYYTSLPKDSLPFIPTSVEVQIITTEPRIPLTESDRIKKRLREITERVNSGESFSTLAIMYSEDKGSAPAGGELGFMGRAQLLPEFSNEAFSLSDPTKVSNIVETEYGFHIIQLIERRGDRANFRHILMRPSFPQSELNKSLALLDSVAKDIQSNKFTFEEAAVFSADKDSRKNGGLMVNSNSRRMYATSTFSMEELPPEIAKTISTMQVGQISEPFKMKDTRKDKDLVAIVKLKSKTEGHIANVSDDYQTLKDIVEQKKRMEELNKWLQKKIDTTYVRINDKWKGCDFKHTGWIKD